MTNSPHVPFFRPLIRLLEERGHEVRVSARDFAQTLELLDAAAIGHDVVGPPARRRRARRQGAGDGLAAAGAARLGQAAGVRPRALPRLARASARRPLARGCGRRTPTTTSSPAPSTRSARARRRASSSRGDPAGPARPARARRPRRCAAIPGLKEEYYLSGFSPDRGVLDELGLDPTRVLVVVRTPPEVSLYHRHGNPLFADVLERLGADPAVQAVVLPRTPAQRDALREARAAVARPARARDRRPEPDRARRPRRLGRRHDESRGGRARDAGVDDLRRHDGRGRRGADRGRAAGGADGCGRARAGEEGGGRRPSCSAIPS